MHPPTPKPFCPPHRHASRGRILSACLLAASCLAATASAQPDNLEDWVAVRSQHFVLQTDAHPRRGVEIARNLELFRNTFALLSPGLELRSAVPTALIAFRDAGTYAPYKSHPDGNGSVLLGQFLIHPDRNFLTFDASARPAGVAPGRRQHSDFAVIYHEFVHYLVAHNFHNVPRWFHEGLAEYYSTFVVEGERIYVGRPVERHLRWLRFDNGDREERSLSHDFSLRAVLTGESGHHGHRAGGFYALSWALVHHLLSGGPERLDRMADFLVRLRDDEDPDRAFENAFDLRLDDLEETLRAYAYRQETLTPVAPEAERSPRRGANETFRVATFDVAELGPEPQASVVRLRPEDVLFRLGDLELRLGRPESAERHFQTALDHTLDHAESLVGLALIRDHQSRFDEADVLYRDALGVGSADPLTYLRYGRHLLARIQPDHLRGPISTGNLKVAGALAGGGELTGGEPTTDELIAAAEDTAAAARAAFATAVDRDRNYAEARALFGYAHLFGKVDPEPGITALEKARHWLPDRDDLTLHLIQLQLKKKDFRAARRLLEGDLREHAGDQAVLWAEEEIERAELLHAASEALDEGEVEDALDLFDQAIAVTSNQDLRDRMAARLTALQSRYASAM